MIIIDQELDLSYFDSCREVCLKLRCKQCGHGDHIIAKNLNGRETGESAIMAFWFICTVHTPEDPCCGGNMAGVLLENKDG